jgi:hypothetical protein
LCAGDVFVLVWCSRSFVFRLFGADSLQRFNKIGDAGAISLGEALKCNSSVQMLNLVSCGDHVCIEHCLLCAGSVFVSVWCSRSFVFRLFGAESLQVLFRCGAVGVLFFVFLALNLCRRTTT